MINYVSLIDYLLSMQEIIFNWAWKRKSFILLIFVWVLAFESASARAEFKVSGINHNDQDTLHLRSKELQLVVVNNEAYGELHREGYNGISELYIEGSPRNFFRIDASALNFEFTLNGDAATFDYDLFEPRRAPMQLSRLTSDKVRLKQPRMENWPLKSFITYELVGNRVEMIYEGIPLKDIGGKYGYIGLFFASYIREPEEKGINFIGKHRTEDMSEARWIYHLPPEHGQEANHRPAGSDWDPEFDEGFPVRLAAGISDLEYIYPFYYGLSGENVLIMMFEQSNENTEMRFAQSPTGGGPDNPAWDFLYFNKEPTIGEKFRFRAAMVVKKYEGIEDIIEEYENWSGETVVGFK